MWTDLHPKTLFRVHYLNAQDIKVSKDLEIGEVSILDNCNTFKRYLAGNESEDLEEKYIKKKDEQSNSERRAK